jgi:type IV secretory pathway VirB10-like protein
VQSHVGKVLVLVAIVAGVSWWILRDKDVPPPPTQGAPEIVAPGGTVPIVPTSPPEARSPRPEAQSTHTNSGPRPELPAPTPEVEQGPVLSGPNEFAAEPRDVRWAVQAEADLRKLAGALPDLQIDSVECKTTHCKLALSGPTEALSSGVDELADGKAGLHAPVVLSQPQIGSDGIASMAAYITFPPRDVPRDPAER